MEMNAEIKALLVSIGSANLDEGLQQEVAGTVPSAGPGAGLESFFIKSAGHRVRLSINKNSPLKVVRCRSGVAVIKDEIEIMTGQLEPALSHCPEQAYITISGRCINDCKFCPVPLLNGDVKSLGTILRLVEEANQKGNLRAISITSGVAKSAEDEVKKAVEVVKALKAKYNMPIGVSVYPTQRSSEDLHDAGATEIKYNVETMDPAIFTRVCPGLSLDAIISALEGAVRVFGKNRVSSNFIIGLGESDECVEAGIEHLAKMGVITNLRPISAHPLRKGAITVERPSSYRLLRLNRINKEILERHGLSVVESRTMCLPCTGCDLVPQRDL
jgi:biotin synthase-related radical SAM superfamily protein